MSLGQRLIHRGWDVTPEGCWVFRGCEAIGIAGKTITTSRAAWLAWRGELNEDDFVIARCGTPKCIRPDHLAIKPAAMFYDDLQAEGNAARLIREDAKPRRYRLSQKQIHEVDAIARKARLEFIEGGLTEDAFQTELWRLQQYVEAITRGCVAPEIGQAVGMAIPEDRRNCGSTAVSDGPILGPIQRRRAPGMWPKKPA